MSNTVFVIMGDHGNRIGQMQRTYVGRIEERSPLFAIRMPKGFAQQHQKEMQNLKRNAKRLTSNFDVHQTFKDIAKATFRSNRSRKERAGRGKSLLYEEMETDRDCEQAGVPMNFCLCMEERKMGRMHNESVEYKEVLKMIKSKISEYKCFDADRLEAKSDRLSVFAVNQMVRHGLRNQNDWPSVQNAQAALEILFLELNVSVPIFSPLLKGRKRADVHFRVKHYVKEMSFSIVAEPLIIDYHQTCFAKTLSSFCSLCTNNKI